MSESARPLALEARGLRRGYDEGGSALEVLRGVDLQVAPGERVAIIGSSGSGKSTLLHLLGGLDRPAAGEVLIGGTPITGLGPTAAGRLRNRRLGFVYQFHHLLAEFSAEENVALPLLIRGEKPAAAHERARDWLGRVGLAGRVAHKPGQLSGGERQRVAIARALVAGPSCVLADEPTGNLDAANSQHIFDLLGEISQDADTAFVVVTHDRALAERMDRVLILRDGVLAGA